MLIPSRTFDRKHLLPADNDALIESGYLASLARNRHTLKMNPNVAPTLEPRQCQVCHTRVGLQRCEKCKLVFYCGREHRASHRASHKRGCDAVRKAVKVLHREEHRLRTGQQGGPSAGSNVFEDYVGRFWEIMGTGPYMKARKVAARVMVAQFNTIDAVETALEHMTDLMRLGRADPQGLRKRVPSLYLRLGRDQECYDFVKWYATKSKDYHWDDMEQPYLDLRDADALESPERLWGGPPCIFPYDFADSIHVLLIKVRILLDLQYMQNATRAFQGFIPPELIDEIRRHALVSGVVAARKDIVLASVERTGDLIQLIRGQIKLLFNSTASHTTSFWPMFVGPQRYRRGYWVNEGTDIKFEYHYEAWKETPGSIELIKSLMSAVTWELESSDDLSAGLPEESDEESEESSEE